MPKPRSCANSCKCSVRDAWCNFNKVFLTFSVQIIWVVNEIVKIVNQFWKNFMARVTRNWWGFQSELRRSAFRRIEQNYINRTFCKRCFRTFCKNMVMVFVIFQRCSNEKFVEFWIIMNNYRLLCKPSRALELL